MTTEKEKLFLSPTEYSFDSDKILEAYDSIFPSKFDMTKIEQVALNSRLNSPDPYFESVGPSRPVEEKCGIEFPILNEIFRGTYFEEIFNTVGEIGRIRFISCWPKTCLTLHCDKELRYQMAIISSKTAYLVHQISDTDLKMYCLPADGKVHLMNTRDMKHSAVNFGLQPRVHLVFCINSTRDD